ncbi:MAG TPA: pseudouridine synthase [Rubrobacteraceae bacterium]|nr:pseudouridine synthase [Rubrobacteraceae bacterium]
MRLQTYLARAGASPSRRKGEALISAGRVTVNGSTATIGTTVSSSDSILLDGRAVRLPQTTAYLALHKPAGYLTTLKDEPGRDRRTIRDLMPSVPGLVPVGRLDAATTGLILLTNDGKFAHRISHPSSEVEKEYLLTVNSPVSDATLAALAAGPKLDDGKMLPPVITSVRRGPRNTTITLTIHEGRNRIIRRACAVVGLGLISLHRTRIGPVRLGDLPPGRHRSLTSSELKALQ